MDAVKIAETILDQMENEARSAEVPEIPKDVIRKLVETVMRSIKKTLEEEGTFSPRGAIVVHKDFADKPLPWSRFPTLEPLSGTDFFIGWIDPMSLTPPPGAEDIYLSMLLRGGDADKDNGSFTEAQKALYATLVKFLCTAFPVSGYLFASEAWMKKLDKDTPKGEIRRAGSYPDRVDSAFCSLEIRGATYFASRPILNSKDPSGRTIARTIEIPETFGQGEDDIIETTEVVGRMNNMLPANRPKEDKEEEA